MIGDGKLYLKHLGQGPQEALGLPERKVEDHAERERCLNRYVRVDTLAAGLSAGWLPPGVQGGIGKPDSDVASTPEALFVLSPIANPIPGLRVLVLAPLRVLHGW